MNTQLNPNLAGRDIVLMVDKSGSMGTADQSGGRTRWVAAKESTIALAREFQQYDPDGITVVPFSGANKIHRNVTPQTVEQVFAEHRPGGSTDLTSALRAVFADYRTRKASGQVKPAGEILVVVTDGEPDDKRSAAQEIISFGNSLSNADQEYGILFIQVGNDPAARSFLKGLDDDLKGLGAKHDIVDTVTMDEADNKSIEELLLGALND
jgi:Mg-chelatase subunit ChlD